MRITGRRFAYGAAGLVGAAVAFWFVAPYNIAASVPHAPGVAAVLHGYLHNAVRTQTLLEGVPDYIDIDDPALIRLGAGHFDSGCATCHGAPGRERNPIVMQMSPKPTDIAEVQGFGPVDYHWIGYNGFKYSGMPAWAGKGREDEVWAIAAFLMEYPELDGESYRELALGDAVRTAADPQEDEGFGQLTGEAGLIASCARCHGMDGLGRDGTAPVLAGQSRSYLRQSLEAYATDARESGIMEPVAAAMDSTQRDTAANYFANLQGLPRGKPGGPDVAALGQEIATLGIEDRDIPACDGCHGEKRRESWPIIQGQERFWIATWLRLWREMPNPAVTDGQKMHAAARNLTDEDIRAVSDYYAAKGDDRREAAAETEN